MVSSRAVSAVVCVGVGLGCIGGVVRAHPGNAGMAGAGPVAGAGTAAGAATARSPEPRSAVASAQAGQTQVGQTQVGQTLPAPARFASAETDTELPTGSIAPGSAVHVPNPAAYRGAPKMGDPVTVEGAEAINYLAGNTLRVEAQGQPHRLLYFASRGVMGEGDERGFTARRWERERPELCWPAASPTASAGSPPCRSVSILLDGTYEFPGAHLGTVTLGPAGGQPAVTAALVKGNAMRFPEHIPFLDSAVDVAAVDLAAVDGGAARAVDPVEALAGHPVAAAVAGARGRQVAYYAKDDRRLELQRVQAGDGVAVQVTVGHWHAAKGGLCQARTAGGAQTCFKVEAAAGGMRLVPTGKGAKGDDAVQTLTVLPEAGAREVAQD